MSHTLPLFLAHAPTTVTPALPRPFTPVPMAYQTAPDGQLFRAGQGALPAGCVLMVGGVAPASPAGLDWFCRQVLAECQAQQATGVLANWAETADGFALAQRLAGVLRESSLSFIVPEAFAEASSETQVLVSSQLSGGTLRGRIREALERYGGRVVLALECSPWDLMLPCPDGQGAALTLPELPGAVRPASVRAWFSENFYCQYATYREAERLHLILYDNAASVQAKLTLAEELGLAGDFGCAGRRLGVSAAGLVKKRPCAVVQGRLYVAGEITPLAPMAQRGYLPKSSKAPFGRHALRSAPRLPAKGGQFDAHSARSVFLPRTWPRPPSLVLRTIHLAPRRKTSFPLFTPWA